MASQRPLTFQLSGLGFVYLYQYLSGAGDEMTPRQVQQVSVEFSPEEPGFVFIGILWAGLFQQLSWFMPSGGIYIRVVLQKES